jgi:hypothetical protein
MKRHGNPTAIGVMVDLVRAVATVERKPVADQCDMISRAVSVRSNE